VNARLDAVRSFFPGSADDSYQWIRTLVELGALVWAADSLRPITIAVCLPRVEFAGLLVAAGACLCATLSPVESDWRQTWKQLIGKRVIYSYRESPYVFWEGILCESHQEPALRLTIQVTESGDVDRPSLEDLHLLRLDLERDGQQLCARIHGKTRFVGAPRNKVLTLLRRHAVGDICSWWHQLTLVGKKSRISYELNEILPFRSNAVTGCTFADLLRPHGWVEDSAILRLISAQELTCEGAQGIIVIEASRLLSDHLRATRQHHRVILLGRNEPHYSDAADVVIGQFQKRQGDFPASNLECTQYINFLIFHHYDR
jgi:hypothetical protein